MAKTNVAMFALKQESTPGTAVALADADVRVNVEPSVESFDTEEIFGVSSAPANIAGRASIGFGVPWVLRGPGDLVTEPAASRLLEAAMFAHGAAKTIAIGAVTSGPFLVGETITGGTSSGKGLVLAQAANGAATIPYLPISGTLQSGEVLTGGTSGATATSSAGPIAGGWAFRPADSTFAAAGHSMTCELRRDGFFWRGRGCLATARFELRNGQLGLVSQRFIGALAAQGDAAMWTVAAYPEASIAPPKALAAGLVIGSHAPVGVTAITIDWAPAIEVVEDLNDSAADGVKHSDYDRRSNPPTLTIEPDQTAAATIDFFAALRAGTAYRVEFVLGATTGSKWRFAMPAAQLTQAGAGERSPRRGTFPMTFRLTGDNNNELLIHQH
jgi:hypothetical protein